MNHDRSRRGSARTRFLTGDIIPASGLYLVHHTDHRLPAEVTLIQGQHFPRCRVCEGKVEFEQVAIAPRWKPGPTRTIVLHELPEMNDE